MRRRIRIRQVVFEQAGLSAGSHVLVVTNTGTTSAPLGGTYVDLDAVDAEGAVVPVVLDRFEDTDAELVFSATGWWTASSVQRSGGSSRVTTTPGASLEMTFTGSVVRLLASTGPNRGIVSVSVDGVETGRWICMRRRIRISRWCLSRPGCRRVRMCWW